MKKLLAILLLTASMAFSWYDGEYVGKQPAGDTVPVVAKKGYIFQPATYYSNGYRWAVDGKLLEETQYLGVVGVKYTGTGNGVVIYFPDSIYDGKCHTLTTLYYKDRIYDIWILKTTKYSSVEHRAITKNFVTTNGHAVDVLGRKLNKNNVSGRVITKDGVKVILK
jgi:hypothetical protein